MKKSLYLYVSFLILGLSIFLLINSVFAWTLPTANPPQGDLPAPLDTSSIEQTKLGNLNLDNNLKVGGLLRIGLYSSHPTGTNGNLYYNTADNKFYGYQNGSWSELGGGGGFWLANGNDIYNANTGNVGIGTTSPGQKLDVSGGNIRTTGQLISTVASGTAPLSVASNTVVTNLNADLLDGKHASNFQTAITNPVTGTGTTNYISKWTGTSTQGNSQIFDNGTNVGIGTTSPGAKLDVQGQIIGGFGTISTGGTLDWNDDSNARPGSGYTLLLGTATNGPGGGVYYHPFSFEYGVGGSIGNLTQLAIPYNSSALNNGIYIRTRYSDAWTNWTRIISENTSGNVGIGTTEPGEKLEVNGNVLANSFKGTGNYTSTWGGWGNSIWLERNGHTGIFYNDPVSSKGFMLGFHGTNDTLYIGHTADRWGTGSYLGAILANGNVGIGTTSPAQKLHVAGNVQASAFYYSSDISLKKEIKPIENSLDKILKLQGVSFKWKENNNPSIGLIAQEVEKIIPEVVITDQNTGLKSIDYGNLVSVLIEAIKEQQTQINELQKNK